MFLYAHSNSRYLTPYTQVEDSWVTSLFYKEAMTVVVFITDSAYQVLINGVQLSPLLYSQGNDADDTVIGKLL